MPDTFNPGEEVWFLTRLRHLCGEHDWKIGRGVVAHEQPLAGFVKVDTDDGILSTFVPSGLCRTREAAESARVARKRNEIEALIDEHRVAIEALELRLAKLEKASDE